MLHSENFATWRRTESGDTTEPNNWGPIARLKITCTINSKQLCGRLRATLGMEHRFDHTGFETHTGIDDAFVAFEPIRSKTKEWNSSVWFQTLLWRRFWSDSKWLRFLTHGKNNMCQEFRALGYGICIGASDGAFISEIISPIFFQRRAGIRNAKMKRKIEKSWFPYWRGGSINEH